ncbi:MAG: hypothetical protein HY744_04550 [Deltaproteobacteria bacterium]|nr:hypothetical protein [Deltaproteobacteria bacterium]
MTASAAAQEENAAAPPCAPAAPVAARSAIESTIALLAAALRPAPGSSFVATAELDSDAPAPRARQLVWQLAELVAGKLGPQARYHGQALGLAAARRLARPAPALVFLRPRIARGRLSLAADLYPVPRGIWQRAAAPEPGPTEHGYAEAALDAEVRGFLEPIPLGEPVVARSPVPEAGVLALGCGDLDADGAPELVAVGRQRIAVLGLRAGEVLPRRAALWSELAHVAPAPLRQPIGFATVVPEDPWSGRHAYADVSLTDRARSVRLDASLRPLGGFEAMAVPFGQRSACTPVRSLLLQDGLSPCTPADPPLAATLGRPTDALGSALVVATSGRAEVACALRDGARLVVRWADGRERTFAERVGAQLAVGDLDQDGLPELATSLDVLDPSKDAVVVRSLLPSGELQERYRVSVPTGVGALAICPPDGPGRPALAVATAAQIWVIR